MKSIVHNENSRDKLLHIETELGVVNIRTGLRDAQGNIVESIEIIPDRTHTPQVHLFGMSNNRLVKQNYREGKVLTRLPRN